MRDVVQDHQSIFVPETRTVAILGVSVHSPKATAADGSKLFRCGGSCGSVFDEDSAGERSSFLRHPSIHCGVTETGGCTTWLTLWRRTSCGVVAKRVKMECFCQADFILFCPILFVVCVNV